MTEPTYPESTATWTQEQYQRDEHDPLVEDEDPSAVNTEGEAHYTNWE